MIITTEFLKEKSACAEGFRYVSENGFIGLEAIPFIERLIEHKELVTAATAGKEDALKWGNWLIVRVMERKQYLQYAIFVAEQVIDIFEKKYPNDKRPRAAIEAVKEYLKNPNRKNASAAASASAAAASASAAAAASAASAAAASSASSAAAAAYGASAASAASAAAAASASAAAYGASAASAAAADASEEMQLKILKYGIELLKEGNLQ